MSNFRHRAAVLLLFCALFLLGSCQKAPPNYLAYQQRSFTADVGGSLLGEEIGARITYTHGGKMQVTYFSPDALEGITVTVEYDENGTQRGEASLGELTVECDPEALSGWLKPLSAWFAPCPEEIGRVQRIEEGYSLLFEDGTTLLVDVSGTPMRLEGDGCSFYVVKWDFLS